MPSKLEDLVPIITQKPLMTVHITLTDLKLYLYITKCMDNEKKTSHLWEMHSLWTKF